MPLLRRTSCVTLLSLALSIVTVGQPSRTNKAREWTGPFDTTHCTFSPTGSNVFFILKPNYRLRYVGIEGIDTTRLVITVLNETLRFGDVDTRVVEERESVNGRLVEVSRNYFAICTEIGSVFYFGEDVDMYKNDAVANHTGSWRAGTDGAKPGIVMPGLVLLGSRYYQELAPKRAMDRSEIVSTNETITTRAGTFTNCLKVEETTPLEPGDKEYKWYAPRVGLVRDGHLMLVAYGFD